MITLFDPNETDFTHNGLGTLDKNIINSVVEEDLNGIFSLSFEYPIFALHGLEIDGQSIIRSPVPDGPDQLFRVYKPTKSMGYLKVECYHVFYDLIDNFIEDTNIVSKDGQTALAQMGSKTQYGHNFRFFSDITTIAGSRVVRKNPIEFLLDYSLENSFVNRWGGELKRNNFDVSMYNSIGSDKGVTIRHKKDLLGYEAVVDWHSPVTRIMPIGFDGLLLPEKYIDSPVINSYVKPKIQKIEYGDVKAAIGQYADDKEAVPLEQAYTELRRLAKLEYSKGKIDYPKASYKVEFVTLSKTEEYKDYISLETVALGDTVTVIHSEDNLDIKAKVIKYRFDPLVKKYIDIELGNFKETFSDTQSKIDSIYNHVEEVKQDISLTIQVSADGKNTIYRGVATPVNARVGDLWYKPIDNGNTEMYIYTDDPIVPWQLIFSTASLDEVSKEVEAVIADMAIEKERINQTMDKADQAITDAGFAKLDATTAKNNAVTAVNTANTAKTNAETALTTSQTSLTSSVDALAKSREALAKATATETTTGSLITSYDALTKTVTLKAEKEELNIVKGTVNKQSLDISANSTAIGLKADNTLVSTIKGTVDKHTLDIKAGADGLLLKADSTLVNTIKGTVDSQGLAITAAANGLTLKADTSVVNTIKGTVDTHTNQIKVVSDGLVLKAESSLVNTINGTVNTHTNQIAANSTAISARLTSAQVDSLVTGKGYATTTALNATSSSLSASIVEVSTDLSNLEIGGRNLVIQNEEWKWKYLTGSETYPNPSNGGNSSTMRELISVTAGENLMFTKSSAGDDYWRVSWLNSSKVYVSRFVNTSNKFRMTVPSGIAYMWVSYPTDSKPKIEKGNKATDWSPAPEDMATVERAVQIEANLNGLQTTVSNKAEQSQVTQLAGQISSKVESATYNSKMTQLDNAINLRVSKANIVTEINLSAETSTVRIAGKRIQLDGDVAMDNAFVNRIKAIEVIADKITSGNLNAANVNIINLNASKITTGILSGIELRSTFNYLHPSGLTNTGVTTIKDGTLASNGNFNGGSGGTYMYINPDTIYGQNINGAGVVRSMFKLSGEGLELNQLGTVASYTQDGIYFQSGGGASINYRASNARIEVASYNGVDLGTKVNGGYQSKFAVGGGKDGITSFVEAYVPFTARQGIDAYTKEIKNASLLSGVNTILFNASSNRIVQGSDGFLNILSPMQLSLGWTNGTSTFTTMIITQNQIVAKKNLNMDGNQMVGVSDSRLKNAIAPTVIDSLSAISRWKFVDFNWRYDDKPKGRQFGLIAQDTPELALYDAKNDEYTISASKQIMMTSHGLSQLNSKVMGITALIHSSNATANHALSEVQMLRQEIQNLRQKNR